jgi:hypothetical protein
MVRRQKYIAANNDKKSGTEEKFLELDSLVAAYRSIVCDHDISKGFEMIKKLDRIRNSKNTH